MSNDSKETVLRTLRTVAEQRGIALPALREDAEIVDELGFTSLAVAALIANLEEELGVDPFQDEDVMITDIRTVADLCRVYENALARVR
ncbi:acyl carrier protein [Lysobacter enzymogenes]|uniref:acyl carrier protein n=1 Tax=Lysobacter enzymogenes TaxID=69 RepID=UPI000899501B|nr:acyl carrier protein [Lysobacter enzymogenes]SDX41125.1 Acyl carrier protein [Lysobacter enzymogenes]